MKFKILIINSLIAGFAICICLISCTPIDRNTDNVMTQSTLKIPVLLERSPQLGSVEEQQYMTDTYRNLYSEILKNPHDWDAVLSLVRLYMLEGRITGEHGHYYPAALKMLDHIQGQSQDEDALFQSNFLKASVLLSLHRFDEALTYGERALEMNAYHASTYGTLVDAHVELGNYAKAVELADQMVSIRPDLRSYSRISYLREIHGDISGAQEAMEMAIKAGMPGYEDAAWCRLTLGGLHESYGELTEARNQYQKALEERNNYPFAIAAIAGIEMKNQNYDKALALLDSACNIIPEVGFYEQKAELYLATGQEKEAQNIIVEILEMLEDDEAHGHIMNLEYAKLYRDLIEDQSKALEYAQKEYEKRPDNIDINLMIASIFYNMNAMDLAEKYLQKAQRTQSKNPELILLSGLIRYERGLQDEGKQMLKTSLEQDPFQQNAHVEKAKMLLR